MPRPKREYDQEKLKAEVMLDVLRIKDSTITVRQVVEDRAKPARLYEAEKPVVALPIPSDVTVRRADGTTETRPMTEKEMRAWLKSEGVDE